MDIIMQKMNIYNLIYSLKAKIIIYIQNKNIS